MTDTIIDHSDNHTDNSGGNEDAQIHTCRFVHPEHGRRCGSPALRGEPFCYHHNEDRARPANPAERKRRRNTFDLAAPDSRSAIQDALGSIFLRIAQNEIDLRRAGLLLYTLQIASTNLAAAQREQDQSKPQSSEQPTDRTAIQHALGKLFPQIDDRQLEPRRAGLLLYCLQIASTNLKAQQPHETCRTHETRRVPHPSRVLCAKGRKNPASTNRPGSNLPGQTTEGAQGFSPAKNPPSTRGFSPGPLADCPNHAAAQVPGTSQDDPLPYPSQPEELENQTTESNAEEALIKGRPISRSTLAALLEALARRQGINVEKLHQAHEATILLRLNTVAEGSQNASAPFMPHHRGTNGVADLLTR